eukprot:8577469-Pyramimonas_sp.AAC.1
MTEVKNLLRVSDRTHEVLLVEVPFEPNWRHIAHRSPQSMFRMMNAKPDLIAVQLQLLLNLLTRCRTIVN